jgi:hypothetical protein
MTKVGHRAAVVERKFRALNEEIKKLERQMEKSGQEMPATKI